MIKYFCASTIAFLGLTAPVHAQDNEGAGPHEAIVKEMLSALEQITEALKTVTDEETAQAAKPALQKVAVLWEQVRKKAEAIKPPSKEERQKVEAYAEKFVAAQKQLFGQISRVVSVPGGREVLREIRAVITPAEKPKSLPK